MNLKVNTSFSKDKYNRLVDVVFSSLVNGGVGYKVRRNKGGTILDIKPGAGSSSIHPLKVFDASADGTPQVKVQIGSYNGVVPTINGSPLTSISDDAAPILTVGASAQIIYAQLNLNANTAEVESVAINSSNSITAPDGDNVTVYQIIAFITMDDGQIASISDNVSGSQAYQACNGQNLFGLI